MRHLNFSFKSRWLLLPLMLLTLSVGNAWGTDPDVSTITSSSWAGLSTHWSASGNAFGYDATKGAQLNGTARTLTATDFTNVTSISISCSKASSATGTITITAGSNSKSITSFSTSPSTETLNIATPYTGTITISLSPSNKSIYIKSITVTYTAASPKTVSFVTGTGNPALNSRTEASGGAGITLPSMSDLTPTCSGDGWVLYGWATAAYGSASTTAAPTTTLVGLAGDKYYPTADATLYAVYRKSAGTPTSTYTTYTINGNWTSDEGDWTKVAGNNLGNLGTTNKWGINSGSSTATSPVSYSDISEIKFTGTKSSAGAGTVEFLYGSGDNWTSLGSKSFGTTLTWSPDPNVSGSLKIVFTRSNGNIYIATIKVTYSNATYYYWSAPTCCTALDQINGRFWGPPILVP